MTEAETLARTCAAAAADKKAEDIRLLDLRGISSFTDFFVVCSGTSDPQLRAIASGVRSGIREQFGHGPLAEDGDASSHWIILDYGQVVVHIFHSEKRAVYTLEDLWGDAPCVSLE